MEISDFACQKIKEKSSNAIFEESMGKVQDVFKMEHPELFDKRVELGINILKMRCIIAGYIKYEKSEKDFIFSLDKT